MRIKKFASALIIATILAVAIIGSASAHTTVHNGPYNVEIGWLDEPPIVGQMNGIIMNLSTNDATAAPVTLTEFQLPLLGLVIVLWVSNAPGPFAAHIRLLEWQTLPTCWSAWPWRRHP